MVFGLVVLLFSFVVFVMPPYMSSKVYVVLCFSVLLHMVHFHNCVFMPTCMFLLFFWLFFWFSVLYHAVVVCFSGAECIYFLDRVVFMAVVEQCLLSFVCSIWSQSSFVHSIGMLCCVFASFGT